MSRQHFLCRDRFLFRQGLFWVSTWFLVSQQRGLQFKTEVCRNINFYVVTKATQLGRDTSPWCHNMSWATGWAGVATCAPYRTTARTIRLACAQGTHDRVPGARYKAHSMRPACMVAL